MKSKAMKKRVRKGIYLLFSVLFGVLFAFGTLDLFKSMNVQPWVPVLIGGIGLIIFVLLGVNTTETAAASKR